jgi:hypothetical protein
LYLRRQPRQAWSRDALVRDLRGSISLVDASLTILLSAGLVELSDAGAIYRPGTEQLAASVDALAELYAQKPIAVISAIFTSPNDKIRSFADAFLFNKK